MQRTFELKQANCQKTDLFINLAHETKTPLTLISNYLNKYRQKAGPSEELAIIEQNINKLKRDMANFLDSEKLERGQIFYNHNQVICLSELLMQKVALLGK